MINAWQQSAKYFSTINVLLSAYQKAVRANPVLRWIMWWPEWIRNGVLPSSVDRHGWMQMTCVCAFCLHIFCKDGNRNTKKYIRCDYMCVSAFMIVRNKKRMRIQAKKHITPRPISMQMSAKQKVPHETWLKNGKLKMTKNKSSNQCDRPSIPSSFKWA